MPVGHVVVCCPEECKTAFNFHFLDFHKIGVNDTTIKTYYQDLNLNPPTIDLDISSEKADSSSDKEERNDSV